MYELMGRAHAALVRQERGQGTVEYVGLVLLIGVLLAAVLKAGREATDTGIASTIATKLKNTIEGLK